MRKLRDPKDRAYVSNYRVLKEWLDRIKAQCMWQLPVGGDSKQDPEAFVEGWTVNGRLFVLLIHAGGLGWDVFTAFPALGIDESMKDAAKRLNLKKEST
jgi:hypothetical protein